MKTLKLNQQLEVSKEVFGNFKKLFGGLVARRIEDNKYYIKPLLFLGYKKAMEQVLNHN